MRSEASIRDPSAQVVVAPGQVLPDTRCRIESWLGEGRCGVVYEAAHEGLGTKVAVKLLPAGLVGEGQLETLRVWVRSTCATQLSALATPLDVVLLSDGRVAFVRELVEGRSLATDFAADPVGPARLFGIMRQLCYAIGTLHEAGLGAGDLGPSDVILESVPVPGGRRVERVRLLDVGLATLFGLPPSASARPYLAPERTDAPVEPRRSQASDIYMLGAWGLALSTKGSATPVKALDRVFQRCLAREPNARFSSVRELQVSLDEAQIALGIGTPWDGLELPKVSDAPRFARRPHRAKRVATAAIVALMAGLGVTALASRSRPQSASSTVSPERIEALERQAKDAAAKAQFVYPPPSDPLASTSLTTILELEDVGNPLARARAEALRSEFAATLARLGDRYWDVPAGRPFAVDFYAQALLFEPSHTRARERGGLTMGELAELRRRAVEGEFTTAELENAESLSAIADPNESRRRERVRAVASRKRRDAVVGPSRLRALLEAMGEPVGAAQDGAVSQSIADALDEPVAVDEPPKSAQAITRDPARARALAREGTVALRQGKWEHAAKAFHGALALDHRCGPALAGLADLHFERARYDQAARFAQRAVEANPRRADYRIKLGDALLKAVRYKQAAQHYARAEALGHPDAASRLAKLEGRLEVGSGER